jgi:ParB family transcriptional regulator, chromosome partitioning protein
VQSVVAVSPFRCEMWKYHDRIEENITEESCSDLISSFTEHGQLVPVLGRRLSGKSDCDIELLYGARRLFVARHINKPLLVELRDISDRDAIIAMDIENRQRKDVSSYERGRSYARWLNARHFKCQVDLARALKISPSQVSRLMKIARLPTVIIDAFAEPSDICEEWGNDLTDALEDPKRRAPMIQTAREIASRTPRLGSRDAFRTLLASSVQGRKPKIGNRDRVVRSEDGYPLFRVRYRRGAIALLLPVGSVSASCLARIEAEVARTLTAELLKSESRKQVTVKASSAVP